MSTGGSGGSLGPLERVPQPKVGKTKAAEVLDRDEMRAEARRMLAVGAPLFKLVIGREVKEFKAAHLKAVTVLKSPIPDDDRKFDAHEALVDRTLQGCYQAMRRLERSVEVVWKKVKPAFPRDGAPYHFTTAWGRTRINKLFLFGKKLRDLLALMVRVWAEIAKKHIQKLGAADQLVAGLKSSQARLEQSAIRATRAYNLMWRHLFAMGLKPR